MTTVEESSPEADLLIVGAGAKAAAIAAKVHVVNQLGLGSLAVTIVEKTEPAASWLGRNGMTSGEESLAIPPIKDVGFPYQSHKQFGQAGDAIDAALLQFSWQRYATERGEYAGWVNSGEPPVRHRDYGAYLRWVLAGASDGVRIFSGRVESVTIEDDPARWRIAVAERGDPGDPRSHVGGALLLTGPGVHRALPHDPEAAPRIFHCDSQRSEFARLEEDEDLEIAILGGGESALSALIFLRALRSRARITVFTPMLPLSRGESFLENRVFADPDVVSWDRLDQQMRRDFVKHTDRGVFDPGNIASVAGDERLCFELGRALHAGAARGGEAVTLEYEAPEGVLAAEFDYLVNCTGFDLLAQLRGLFSDQVRAVVEREAGQVWDTPPGTEVPIGRALELRGLSPRLHIPGLGGLSQGPGFANLGCLGLTANRVLQPLLPELAGERLAMAAESR
ncbi:MAG: SidA/IucD/PvdA family monooxygenase [Solirubrobacterales bacterium]